MKTIRTILCLCAAALLCACSAPGSRLVILHCNDTHSHLDPLRDGTGGIIERAAYVDSVRARKGARNVLLLHAGDFSQGTSYFTLLNGDLEISLINAMGYDCVTLGNHEFDNGLEELGRRLSSLNCPVVCANYDFTPFEAGKYITPYTIVRKAGINIGIIGLLCDVSSVVSRETADRMPYLGPDAEVSNKWAKYLKEEALCDKVILLTHIGYEADVALAPQLHNVDLIVGGHSHTFLEAPTLCEDADGKTLPVITDGCWGLEMGEWSF
ncbi:MAG: metallophosphoesterase [Bacteroidales bacterium]|nr:metallophosphoesterase [Bacteroidales bacterium]